MKNMTGEQMRKKHRTDVRTETDRLTKRGVKTRIRRKGRLMRDR